MLLTSFYGDIQLLRRSRDEFFSFLFLVVLKSLFVCSFMRVHISYPKCCAKYEHKNYILSVTISYCKYCYTNRDSRFILHLYEAWGMNFLILAFSVVRLRLRLGFSILETLHSSTVAEYEVILVKALSSSRSSILFQKWTFIEVYAVFMCIPLWSIEWLHMAQSCWTAERIFCNLDKKAAS